MLRNLLTSSGVFYEFSFSDIEWNWLPFDWRWNEALHRFIQISCIRSGHDDVNKKLNDTKELGNQ